MNTESSLGAWRSALEWFQAQPMGRRKVELTAIIRPIYMELGNVGNIQGLEERYNDPLDREHALDIARASYPDNEHLWNLTRTRDVAYGLRLAELERSPQPER